MTMFKTKKGVSAVKLLPLCWFYINSIILQRASILRIIKAINQWFVLESKPLKKFVLIKLTLSVVFKHDNTTTDVTPITSWGEDLFIPSTSLHWNPQVPLHGHGAAGQRPPESVRGQRGSNEEGHRAPDRSEAGEWKSACVLLSNSFIPIDADFQQRGKGGLFIFPFFFCLYVYASSLPSAVQLLTNGKMIISKTMPHWFTSKADSLKGVVCSRTPMTTLGPQFFVCVPFSACVFPL